MDTLEEHYKPPKQKRKRKFFITLVLSLLTRLGANSVVEAKFFANAYTNKSVVSLAKPGQNKISLFRKTNNNFRAKKPKKTGGSTSLKMLKNNNNFKSKGNITLPKIKGQHKNIVREDTYKKLNKEKIQKSKNLEKGVKKLVLV